MQLIKQCPEWCFLLPTIRVVTQLAFTCSKLTIETQERGKNYFRS